LIALNALYRPGPMEQIDTYIRRRRGLEPPVYDVPELEPLLKSTYGIIVYQEQVIQIVHKLAGYTMTKADDFRRSMGKKKAEIMAQEKANFITGAVKHKIPKDKAERIFDFLEKFAGYGFNRSHSAAYALLAYWTAYLKVHHSVEFMAALLTSETGNHDKIAEYVGECRKLKVPVLPPDVNRSRTTFSVEEIPKTNGDHALSAADGAAPRQGVRFGLVAIKNAGEAAMAGVVRVREADGPFRSLEDFCERLDGATLNRKVMESLVKCGAFDALGSRAALLAALPKALERGSTSKSDRAKGQETMFGNGAKTPAPEAPLPRTDETVSRDDLAHEKELLGCYVSGHPLADYEDEIRQFSTQSLKPDQLAAAPPGPTIKVAGIVTRVKHGLTKQK
ncbi:MAG: DNA polymerase III subunit alpha, partial [bacterium]